MLSIFRNYQFKKSLNSILSEINANWETYHVLDQRRFFDMTFQLKRWEEVQLIDSIKKNRILQEYGHRLRQFNEVLEDSAQYEQWYTGEPSHKTRDNAKILHQKKHAMTKYLEGLDAIIEDAHREIKEKLNRIIQPAV